MADNVIGPVPDFPITTNSISTDSFRQNCYQAFYGMPHGYHNAQTIRCAFGFRRLSWMRKDVSLNGVTIMKKDLLRLVAVGLIFCSLGAQAQTVYHVDRVVGSGTVSGFIETDGTTGSLSMGNIVSWSFDLFDGSDTMSISSASPWSGLQGAAWSYLSATSSELSFDFDGTHADTSVEGITFHGQDDPLTQTYSVDYNLLGNILGKVEQLVHQFGEDGEHSTAESRTGVVVIGTTKEPTVYDYQFLDHPGTAGTQVFGINEKGDVVGNGVDGPDANPFVYSINHDTLTLVAEAAGYNDTPVLDISSPGVMVGSVESLDSPTTSGFMRDKDGAFTVFSHPENAVGAICRTLPRGVNSNGLVSGYLRYCESGNGTVGFIYDPKKGTFTDIVPSLFTIAQGINNAGDVVGHATFSNEDDPCGSPVSNRYGWLRIADGSVTYFQVNGERTDARGIDDGGFIVGAFRDSVSGEFKGFKIKLAGGSSCESVTVAESDLLVIPGQIRTIPEGISNSGIIVGITLDELGLLRGFIATPQ